MTTEACADSPHGCTSLSPALAALPSVRFTDLPEEVPIPLGVLANLAAAFRLLAPFGSFDLMRFDNSLRRDYGKLFDYQRAKADETYGLIIDTLEEVRKARADDLLRASYGRGVGDELDLPDGRRMLVTGALLNAGLLIAASRDICIEVAGPNVKRDGSTGLKRLYAVLPVAAALVPLGRGALIALGKQRRDVAGPSLKHAGV